MPCCAPSGAACPEKPCWGWGGGCHSLAHAWGQRESLGDNPKGLGTARGARGWDPALTCRWLCHPPGAGELQKGSREVLGGDVGHRGGAGDRSSPPRHPCCGDASLAAVTAPAGAGVWGRGERATGSRFGCPAPPPPPGDALPLGDSATAGGDSPGGGSYLQLPASDRPRSWHCCSCSLRESAAVSRGGASGDTWGPPPSSPSAPRPKSHVP